jgi:hypothetical protein
LQLEKQVTATFNKDKGILALLDNYGKTRLAYNPPLIHLLSNKSVTLPLKYDASSTSLPISLPDLSFPVVIAFSLCVPDTNGAINFSFPLEDMSSLGADAENADVERIKSGEMLKVIVYTYPLYLIQFSSEECSNIQQNAAQGYHFLALQVTTQINTGIIFSIILITFLYFIFLDK